MDGPWLISGPLGRDSGTRYPLARNKCVIGLDQLQPPQLTPSDDVPQWMGDWLPQIAFGATGLIGAILWSASTHKAGVSSSRDSRTVYLLVKRPWRLYIDRAEFAFLSLLCILWTCGWSLCFLDPALTTWIQPCS